MNKKVIFIGLGAVAAYFLYKKFVATSAEKATEETAEEPAAEEAPAGGGGGGGGGAVPSASEPTSATKEEVMPKRKNSAVKPTSVSGLAVAKPRKIGKPKTLTSPVVVTKPRPVSKPTRPIPTKPKVVVTKVKFAGFMDFDGCDDVQGQMM
jgi:hypothetical protein